MEIKKERCSINLEGDAADIVVRKPVLENEIEGLDTYYSEFNDNIVYSHGSCKGKISIFLFTKGEGRLSYGRKVIRVKEVALFIPSLTRDVTIEAGEKSLGFIEIEVELTDKDIDFIRMHRKNLPYYISYSESKPYKESIKSEKTTSRMLLPENIIPRFCIGSVETTGPDEVGSHSHAMLEQLFFGLEKNNCIVIADDVETAFEEAVLLHVPLGSEHGVKVKNGKILNYIWMDFFRLQDDMGYITDNHILEED